MRLFIVFLLLVIPMATYAEQTCERGQWRYSAWQPCAGCVYGYYCPDDDNDDMIECPEDTTDWNTLLEECGYHPLKKIESGNTLKSWSGGCGPNFDNEKNNCPADMYIEIGDAYDISHCRVEQIGGDYDTGKWVRGFKLQEGVWEIYQKYNPERGDYWNGCDHLGHFYSANAGYYLSNYVYTPYVGSGDLYNAIKPCTNPHPEHSHYSGPGTPDAIDGSYKDKNDCPWECDDGYGLRDGECVSLPFCTAGATKFHAGEYVFNIYKDKLTTPAINIQFSDGTICYVSLKEGSATGALNVDYNGVVYHTSD